METTVAGDRGTAEMGLEEGKASPIHLAHWFAAALLSHLWTGTA